MKKYIVSLFAFFCFSIIADNANLLSNGFKGWIFWPTDKKSGSVSLDKAGEAKINLVNINEKRAFYTYFQLKAGTQYNLSFRIKTRNVISEGQPISVSLGFTRKNKDNFANGRISLNLGDLTGSADWKDFSFDFTAPDNSEICQLSFSFGNTKGEIFIDSVKVIENKIKILKSSKAPVIDGLENDPCWQKANSLEGFYISDYKAGKPQETTKVKISYDDENLYIFCKCYGNTKFLRSEIKQKDGRIWTDDCAEFFISPEYGKIYHIAINPKGIFYDSEIILKEHTDDLFSFKSNKAYDSDAKIKTEINDDSWTVEAAIPLSKLGIKPAAGKRFKINFTRENKTTQEESTYSRLSGAFCQPKLFSSMEFEKDGAAFYRYTNKNCLNPLDIKRKNALFEELLLETPGNYQVHIWDHNALKTHSRMPKKIQKIQEAEWKKEVIEHLNAMAESGMMGSSLPWADSGARWWQTKKMSEEQYKKFGTKRKAAVEHTGLDHKAIKDGGEVLATKHKVSLIDPSYVNAAVKYIRKMARKYKDLPYIATIEGRDEPHIPVIQGKISEMGPKQREWDREVREEYGFGRFSTPAPNDPSYASNPKERPFQWIAFNRWMSDKYFQSKMLMYKALKEEAPELVYIPCDFWFMSGFDPYDYSLFGKCGDMVSCDPYASSAEIREGRGIYNHGFGTKLMVDLSGKPCVTVVQAYQANGTTPTPANLREWTSQALKTGASRIEFFELCAKYRHPELYKEMLKIGQQLTKMKKLNTPKTADCAIIISIDSEAIAKQANADEIYTAYSILGEKVGSWFEFIADRQLERGEKDLSKYKIIYLPRAKYFTQKAAKTIKDYVKNGGTLVIGDPESFSFDIDGTETSKFREELCGAQLTGEKFKASEITMKEDGKTYKILKKDSCYNKLHEANAISTNRSFWNWLFGDSSSPKNLAVFENGQEALIENRYGEGKVFYFTANPFGPDVLLIDSKLEELFKKLQKKAGAKTDLPIWNFLLPEKATIKNSAEKPEMAFPH